MDMYAQVLADALKQGKHVADCCKFYIQFGSQETREYCISRGYLDVFKQAGAIVIEPSCGACINAGPLRPGKLRFCALMTICSGRVETPGPALMQAPQLGSMTMAPAFLKTSK